MEKILFPTKESWEQLMQRPVAEKAMLNELIKNVFTEIKNDGDKAVIKYSKSFDKIEMQTLLIT